MTLLNIHFLHGVSLNLYLFSHIRTSFPKSIFSGNLWVEKACIIMYAFDYRLVLQWMPLDLLIQHVHHALKVMYSYRYYNYTDGHCFTQATYCIRSPSHLYHMGFIPPLFMFFSMLFTEKFIHSSATS